MLDAVQVQDCKNKQIEQSRAFARSYYSIGSFETVLPIIIGSISITIGVGIGTGIGVGQCRHAITDQAETRTTNERNIGAH